ncbi:DUF4915 domain-containing protein [Pseudomonas gingeri]|uniref:DUF4915 domain-containing protein n=1 Tax=Pseudomonas gingeri TaxID=117681 RepID=UPI0015A01B77|nr:DUF4915 domain-containing protein [Pseudomonas gingeri]NWD77187.1 DUF4915 domain-containing protein [Pseudomonas gingeri]
MPHLFNNLLISSPNGGGLLFIHRDQAFHLDSVNTTGLSLSGTTLLRGLQPQGLVLYKGPCVEQHNVPHIDDIHDVLIAWPFLYTVGTTANEILQLNEHAEEIRRWTLDGEADAKHLNCLAVWDQRIVFCAFGDFTEHRQYKGKTEQAGFVQDLHSGERLITGLSQPHSLLGVGEHLLLANSETQELREYDRSGLLVRSKTLDGYTRGICVHNGKVYIGLSSSRDLDNECLSSARLVALDSQSWQELGHIDLPVSEVYSVHGIENPDVIPGLLAGISQHASSLYQHSINERDIKLQKLLERTAQLEQLNTSIEEQLRTQLENTQALLTARDTELSVLGDCYEASHHQHQQTLDKLDTAVALLRERNSSLTALSQRYEDIRHQHERLLNSHSWRVTRPIRHLRRWLQL